MIKIGDNYYRNLEEQVLKNKEDIAQHYEIDRVLANLGIKLIGQVETEADLPDPLTYEGEYGDAYAVGNRAAVNAGTGYYTYYVFSRPDADAGNPGNHWLNVGRISIVGPQGPIGPVGPEGPEGKAGSKWYSGTSLPSITTEMEDGFQALNTTNGDVYQLTTLGNGSRTWIRTGNIQGPQGIQGVQGPIGPQGPQGQQGEKGATGDVGGFINIRAILSNADQLPTPASLNNLTVAYLVGSTMPYDLYVQVGESSATATWNNTGAFNAATLVTVGGVGQNVWEADTKLDKVTNVTVMPQAYVKFENGTQGVFNILPTPGAGSSGIPNKAYVDNYLTPKPLTDTFEKAYGGGDIAVLSGDVWKKMNVTGANAAYTIAMRQENGVLNVGTPTADTHAANKAYVNDGFVAKQERTSTNRAAVYGISKTGEPTLFVADAGQGANHVVMSDDYGCLYAAEPRIANNCATKNYVDTAMAALGIKSPTAVYEGYCSSNTVSVGTSFDSWKIENQTYNIYEFDISGLSKVTILSNLNGTVALGNPKSCIFMSTTKEGNCVQATANITLTPSDTMSGPFTLTPPTGAKYLYISTFASQSTPHIQGF